MGQLSHLPHIQNVEAGASLRDPVHNSIFDVTFELPTLVAQSFSTHIGTKTVVELMGEQIVEVSGLEALQKTPGVGEQKFRGVTVSFLNPTLDSTAADITIKFNLNLFNHNDNAILRIFKAWAKIGYDLSTGARMLKADYVSPSLLICEANRDGEIWRAYSFKNVMVTGIAGLSTLNYTSNEAQQLDVTFRADHWEEILATGDGSGIDSNGESK